MADFRIRPATEADLEGIARIHTYYVKNTLTSLTTEPRTHVEYLERFRNITSRGLPYLVAEDNNTTTDSSRREIVGFANAHPFRGGAGAYASTAELTIFCDPAFVGRGLGGELLAAVVGVLKENRANAELILDEYRGMDPQIAQLLAVMAYDPSGTSKLNEFYEKNGFTRVGHLRKVGYKFGKWIDTIYLQVSLGGEPVVNTGQP